MVRISTIADGAVLENDDDEPCFGWNTILPSDGLDIMQI